ncbi:SLAM family member 5 isoform X3 [Grus americana]|uniref:SLAM family member 5 isoform X3 n=1 Tax=Grus americana TaxID=9117 RepID=UPI002407879E|nr:SLAM family member 5 isoform X3 [Grus americana]
MDVFWCLPFTLLLLHQANQPVHGIMLYDRSGTKLFFLAEVVLSAKDPSLSRPTFSTSQTPSSLCILSPGVLPSSQLLSPVCIDDGAEVTRAAGSSVTFHLQNLHGQAAVWSFHNNVIATVIFGNPPEVIFFDDNYKTRLAFTENGTALTINQLRMDDAGTYTAKISGVKNTLYLHTLHMYRELVVPTVTCVAQNCSANSCSYTLHCTVSGSGSDFGNVSYDWSMEDQPWSKGPMVLVEELPQDKLLLLTCTVRNPISSRNITIISPAALCAGNSHGTYSSRQVGIVAISVIVVGVLLAVVIFVIYRKCKGQRIFCLPAAEAMNTGARAEYMTVYAQIGPSQQEHLQSFSNAQQDNTKMPPTPSVDTSQTIYFTVQDADG